MREPFELVHHNRYRVSCRPEPTPDGTFLARVVVSWIDDTGAALDHRLRPELPPFRTAGEAADIGRDVALRFDPVAPLLLAAGLLAVSAAAIWATAAVVRRMSLSRSLRMGER